MDPYKVIIAGGRYFNNYELLKERCDYYLQNKLREGRVVIVSGHALGLIPSGNGMLRNVDYSVSNILLTGRHTAKLPVLSGMNRWRM